MSARYYPTNIFHNNDNITPTTNTGVNRNWAVNRPADGQVLPREVEERWRTMWQRA